MRNNMTHNNCIFFSCWFKCSIVLKSTHSYTSNSTQKGCRLFSHCCTTSDSWTVHSSLCFFTWWNGKARWTLAFLCTRCLVGFIHCCKLTSWNTPMTPFKLKYTTARSLHHIKILGELPFFFPLHSEVEEFHVGSGNTLIKHTWRQFIFPWYKAAIKRTPWLNLIN